jgi:hypothetical protein
VFENRVLRRDEIIEGWRKLHNEELHELYSSPNIIMGDKRNTYRVLVGKPEGKRLLGGSRRKWKDNIKMDLRETGWGL